MLFIALILSALLLLIANWAARRARRPCSTIVWSSLAFTVGHVFLACALVPAVALQGVLLCGATIVWRATRRGPAAFLALSGGATLIAWSAAGMMAWDSEREYERLRLHYPYESMESRLPTPRAVRGGSPLLPAPAERLARLEGRIPEHAKAFREFQLRKLHEDAVSLFINSPGFGIARMLNPSEQGLALNMRYRAPVPLQPGSRFTAMWSPGELQRLPADLEPSLGRVLENSILDFVNLRGFGYFKDRRHVAGFESHRFSEVPDPADRWKVQAIELISLLLHDKPEVYVSSDLPRMDRLDGVQTRPIDQFESFGLDALRAGEDIFTSRASEGARMVGAVRSTKQCVACHGGERGALLGAFSYTLRAEGP